MSRVGLSIVERLAIAWYLRSAAERREDRLQRVVLYELRSIMPCHAIPCEREREHMPPEQIPPPTRSCPCPCLAGSLILLLYCTVL